MCLLLRNLLAYMYVQTVNTIVATIGISASATTAITYCRSPSHLNRHTPRNGEYPNLPNPTKGVVARIRGTIKTITVKHNALNESIHFAYFSGYTRYKNRSKDINAIKWTVANKKTLKINPTATHIPSLMTSVLPNIHPPPMKAAI
jgi:hypothetical protein